MLNGCADFLKLPQQHKDLQCVTFIVGPTSCGIYFEAMHLTLYQNVKLLDFRKNPGIPTKKTIATCANMQKG